MLSLMPKFFMPVILFAKKLSFTYFCFSFGQAAKYSKLLPQGMIMIYPVNTG